MIASELISYDIPPLKLSDTGAKALDWMEEFKTSELPVVDANNYVGLISESEVLDRNNIDDAIKSYNLLFKKPSVQENQHLFEIISLIVQYDINILPVIDKNEQYLGVVTSKKIIQYLAQVVSVAEAGSILTIEVNVKDYSLAEISRMVESDDANILASFITSHKDSNKLEVTLKINKTEISRILHTFERFNYTVLASYNESEYHKDLHDRYDEFMRFLNP
ncbi:MAG: CBS domain-containing protein [Flavobacteriales bacterium]|nr:MAG: CBS domain-containing protein [Flavobacteriales bacterium]